jgi:hypothetical protein
MGQGLEAGCEKSECVAKKISGPCRGAPIAPAHKERYRMTPPARGRCPSPRNAERCNVGQKLAEATGRGAQSRAARPVAAAEVGVQRNFRWIQVAR